jgi:KipI family sensor histidine kinase inhibitor
MEYYRLSSLIAESRDAGPFARIHLAGSSAILLDVEAGAFSMDTQQRLWAVAEVLNGESGSTEVREVIPGMNNMMVVFDPLRTSVDCISRTVLAHWNRSIAQVRPSRLVEVPVTYGGALGQDLDMVAEAAGLDALECVRRHSETDYTVACLGSMPGFAYLAGLLPEFCLPRRAVPRMKLPKGSVIIGGSQASVLPSAGPCGWHVLGTSDMEFFDPLRDPPCRLSPGDRVRFVVRDIHPVAQAQAGQP